MYWGQKLNGHLNADYACIEADEASTRYIFPAIHPDYMVLTNLFRDQLDRYGEIDLTMNILEEMIRTQPQMMVIVNGDDALSAFLAMDSKNPYVAYGISHPVMKNETNEIREGRFCKKCGERLSYSFTITVSLEIINVPNVVLPARSLPLTQMMSGSGISFPSGWKIS